MPKIRLTKTELKKQKEDLKRFQRYLPLLVLKKKQLQLEIVKVHRAVSKEAERLGNLRNSVLRWVDVFAEKNFIQGLLSLGEVEIAPGNVAGVDIPVLVAAQIEEKAYDFMLTPLWVDEAVKAIKETLSIKVKLAVYHKQLDILKEELRIATQRVNLFEKVKIPASSENIRVIQIALGEVRTAEVVRGKIAKAKLEKRKALSAA